MQQMGCCSGVCTALQVQAQPCCSFCIVGVWMCVKTMQARQCKIKIEGSLCACLRLCKRNMRAVKRYVHANIHYSFVASATPLTSSVLRCNTTCPKTFRSGSISPSDIYSQLEQVLVVKHFASCLSYSPVLSNKQVHSLPQCYRNY